MSATFRPLDLEIDASRYAELLSTIYPEPVTVAQVREWDEHFPRDGFRQRMVAVNENNLVVGCNEASHRPHMLPKSFWIDVIVMPGFRRRGIGSRLYEIALTAAELQGATRLECEVRDHTPEWLQFALARRFQIDRHVFESTLDLTTFDESPFAGTLGAVQAQGVRFFTLADAGNTEANQRKLYELNKRNALDIPGSEGTFPRFEDFSGYVFQASWFRAAGQILAAEGDRWIGLSAVGYFTQTNSSYNMHTGVLKEYRGRKIALALKLLAIRRARDWGAAYIRTNNDSQNAPILAINQKLGYKPEPGFYRCVQKLQNPATDLSKVKKSFDARFARWQITLPDAAILARRKGTIRQNGWTINYRFGEENGKGFLEYFASHRMTNDTLNRILEDGSYGLIGACQEFYDADNPKAKQEYERHNQAFYRLVEEKDLL